ncbi:MULTISPECIES: peptide ABC transporter ATP-binding protein [unclassified Burkholderia]|uniref:peptide ABC transporter ATP-binding protein n=1 Tax=unclassified Burkholderia TaxID=2613784 RepID=UPI000F5AAB09|nr:MULTISPECIES: peptide ABC transporter ATP-binding protein [unclassified Burkholderia]RQS56725.1 ABC transporter ATP-binding protein [Burkholderia sp. Bp8986]RQS61055.1 ABC transporter ATP-binding protein [Burkholderia sp. Bp8984]
MNAVHETPRVPHDEEAVLVADRLAKHYTVKRGMFGQGTVKALNGVSFTLKRGKTLAVVGESGCGKSTLARQLTMIETPTSGHLTIDGKDVAGASRETVADLRRRVQMVFQNPFASLNPRKTVEQTLSEPLEINANLTAAERAQRVAQIMRTVGLRPEHAKRYPHMFSGGQRQRVAIARAMILDPRIVVADEPVSALDVSIQAQILNLFMDLQEQFKTSYVFISHNLSVVEHVADDVMVMYFGSVAELGDKATIYAHPRHPYTRALMSATPAIFEEDRRVQIKLQGELPSPLNPPSGCAFHQRCPYAVERCRVEEPQLRDVDGRRVACHRAEEVGEVNA